jgi:hypothetical protein
LFAPCFDILPEAQRRLWPELQAVPDDFALYGGTAVALRLGHRASVDFDFFSNIAIDSLRKDQLLRIFGVEASGAVLQNEANALSFTVERAGAAVKLSFFGGFGRVGQPESTADGVICVASALDLFGHKLKVLHDRAEAKDYQDIAALLAHGAPIESGLAALEALFGRSVPPALTLKALTYFDDVNEAWRLTPPMKATIAGAVRAAPLSWPAAPIVSRALGCVGTPITPPPAA